MQYNKRRNIFRRFGCLRLLLSPFIDRKQVIEFLNSRITTRKSVICDLLCIQATCAAKTNIIIFLSLIPLFYIHVNEAIKAIACTAVSYVLRPISISHRCSRLPITRNFKGNRKQFELSGVQSK